KTTAADKLRSGRLHGEILSAAEKGARQAAAAIFERPQDSRDGLPHGREQCFPSPVGDAATGKMPVCHDRRGRLSSAQKKPPKRQFPPAAFRNPTLAMSSPTRRALVHRQPK